MSGPRQGGRWDELRAVLRPQEAAHVYAWYGVRERLWRATPLDHRRLGLEMQAVLFPALKAAAGLG